MQRRVTTQDISWFLDLHNNEQLELNPTYQRRSVWTPKDRRFFLDTIFRGFPSPSIFLNKTINDKGKNFYHVVDGKQRLETIINFVKNKIAMDKKFGDIRLDNKKWRHLQSDEDILLRRKFWDYVIPVEFINVEESGTYVNEVFDRLNRNSRKLVEQELRHAKYDGWFINFVEKESESSEWKELKISTTARAKRMKDVQFISELFIITMIRKVCGFDQANIDNHYATYDDPFDEDFQHDFDEEHIKSVIDTTKNYLIECEKNGEVITKFAKDFKHFYSLWAIVSLNINRLLAVDDFISTYSNFMGKVEHFKDPSFIESYTSGASDPELQNSFRYYSASVGANTEEPQRKIRHAILLNTIFGDDMQDEDSTID
jgi:Protein of unknown function DUF262